MTHFLKTQKKENPEAETNPYKYPSRKTRQKTLQSYKKKKKTNKHIHLKRIPNDRKKAEKKEDHAHTVEDDENMELKIPAEEEFAVCMESLAPKRSADRDEEEEDAPEGAPKAAAGFLPSIAVLSQPNRKNYLTERNRYG